MMKKNETGLLYGKQAILEYLGVSDFIFKQFIAAGMPVKTKGQKKTSVAHKENIEEWIKEYTSGLC